MAEKITFKISRYNPLKDRTGTLEEFKVDFHDGWTVLDYLNHIKWYVDGTLTYRKSCRSAICGSCAMTINKVNRLACKTQVKDLKTTEVIVEPLKSFPVIRDLVVDMTEFYEKIEEIKPWLIVKKPLGDKEMHQTQEERNRIDEAVMCILCGACTSSCPSYWYNKDYLGPAALYKAFRFAFDTRDDAFHERLDIVNDKNGMFRCHTIFNCVEACPKNLNPTHGISELKKACFIEKM
jgi:succinate dehydrogenase / fumarate reductase iron-sulfur subunit